MRYHELTIPNVLSAARLALAPLLLVLAWDGARDCFLVVLVVSLLTDAIDGPIARRMKLESPFGSRLDSWGDLANYTCLPLCAWWLWPDVIRQEAPFVAATVGSYIVPTVIGVIKFRHLTCFHAYSAKVSAVLIGCSAIALLAGWSPWPLRISAPVVVLSAMDDMAITFILKRWQPNVPSFLHALRIRREQT